MTEFIPNYITNCAACGEPSEKMFCDECFEKVKKLIKDTFEDIVTDFEMDRQDALDLYGEAFEAFWMEE